MGSAEGISRIARAQEVKAPITKTLTKRDTSRGGQLVALTLMSVAPITQTGREEADLAAMAAAEIDPDRMVTTTIPLALQVSQFPE